MKIYNNQEEVEKNVMNNYKEINQIEYEKNNIQRGIEFAINNWLFPRPDWYHWLYEKQFLETNYWEDSLMNTKVVLKVRINYRQWWDYATYNLVALVSSKPFIKALSKWYSKKLNRYKISELEEDYQYITIQQAIAIRENKLAEFFNNLINK